MRFIYLVFFALIFTFNYANAQNATLTKKSKKIKILYEELQKTPTLRFLKRNYISNFPKDSITFWNTFMDEKQLYFKSHDYIEKFVELGKEYPNLVGKKLIGLCIGLKEWEADAVGDIQHYTMQYANKNYKYFIPLIKKLNDAKINLLITFLADVESHDAYTDYKDFISKLKFHKETKLLHTFEKAREKRKLQHDH